MYIFQDMPLRWVWRGSYLTLGSVGVISSLPTSQGGDASSSTLERHRPTWSDWICKAWQDPLPDPIEELEEDATSQEATDDDIIDEAQSVIPEERVGEDRQAGPIPGGPEDLSVLVSFRTHVAM